MEARWCRLWASEVGLHNSSFSATSILLQTSEPIMWPTQGLIDLSYVYDKIQGKLHFMELIIRLHRLLCKVHVAYCADWCPCISFTIVSQSDTKATTLNQHNMFPTPSFVIQGQGGQKGRNLRPHPLPPDSYCTYILQTSHCGQTLWHTCFRTAPFSCVWTLASFVSRQATPY